MNRSSLALSSILVGSLLLALGCGSGEDSSTSSGSTSSAATTSGAGGAGGGVTTDASSSTSGTGGAGGGAHAEDYKASEADFTCMLKWDAVHRFRVANKLGHQAEALAVANSPTGGVYPVGTILQLVPTEAMVKRGPGFNTATKDWEFFFLGVDAAGTTIKARGTTDVVNGFNGNCFNCHTKAMPQWDLTCEQTHGCDPIPVTADQIKQAQEADPRCGK